jgi:hypothetical protein
MSCRSPEAFCYEGHPLQLVDTAPVAQPDRRRAYIAKVMEAAVNRDYDVTVAFGLGTSGGFFLAPSFRL